MKRIYFGGPSGPTMSQTPMMDYLSKGEAAPFLTIYRFRILICPIWMLGYQFIAQRGHGSSFMILLIPPFAFEWRTGHFYL